METFYQHVGISNYLRNAGDALILLVIIGCLEHFNQKLPKLMIGSVSRSKFDSPSFQYMPPAEKMSGLWKYFVNSGYFSIIVVSDELTIQFQENRSL